MALPILAVLGGLKLIPKLFKAVKGGDKSLLSKAIDVAKVITGSDNETDAVEALKADPEKMYEYQMALLADKHIPDRLDLENVKDARAMYKEGSNEMADEIAGRITKWNLPAIIGLVVIDIIAVAMLKEDPALIAVISGFVGSAVTALTVERLSVINFFFGSSKGSKDKDKK